MAPAPLISGPMAEPERLLFEAVITPHRSLSRRGVMAVAGALIGLGAGVSTLFWWLGAWPVAGFNGADLLLAAALLRHNARDRRESEVLRLTGSTLLIIRTGRAGARQECALPASWLRVDLAERPGRVPALILTTRDAREEVAVRLGEREKRDLAASLAAALHAARYPRFDNPQLRE
jgi:uncharacterized membrane protein